MKGADPELLGKALFLESDTDICIYYGIPLYGMYKDGGSPLWAGKRMRELWPGRVELYGPVSPSQDGACDEVERLVAEDDVIGIKLYPMDIIKGEIVSCRLDDPEIAFPLLEKAQSLGIKVVAIHKSIPQGQVPPLRTHGRRRCGLSISGPELRDRPRRARLPRGDCLADPTVPKCSR